MKYFFSKILLSVVYINPLCIMKISKLYDIYTIHKI